MATTDHTGFRGVFAQPASGIASTTRAVNHQLKFKKDAIHVPGDSARSLPRVAAQDTKAGGHTTPGGQ
jgi:hypothetical protein